MKIARLDALEILDSRGRPTVKATCTLEDGATASASVPSGASTGSAEARERRDGDPKRYGGLGCRGAVESIRGEIARAASGRNFASQEALDRFLIELDGTPDKSRLGSNAILAVSVAFARAGGGPLYERFARIAGTRPALPRPMVNLFSGGKHAGGQVEIQDVLVVPTAARTIDEALATVSDVYRVAAAGSRPLVADEGGLAPAFPSCEAMIESAAEAVRRAGVQAKLAVDVAASHFFRDGRYVIGGLSLEPAAMIERLHRWMRDYPIVSLEDGLHEEAWDDWPKLRGRARIVGDDLLCTNAARIRRAVAAGAADALLLKVNQVGTLTEAAESLALARTAGWRVVASARSGETEDDWLADLAVGWAADSIKIGSITRSERLAKYNRLLEIERAGIGPLSDR